MKDYPYRDLDAIEKRDLIRLLDAFWEVFWEWECGDYADESRLDDPIRVAAKVYQDVTGRFTPALGG